MPSSKQRWGAIKESVAEEALEREGFAIVERNWRCVGGEIDRIAWEGNVLCFVEVRARSTTVFGSPAETVNRRKQKKLAQVASAYLAHFPANARPMARFDVVSIVDEGNGRASISLIRNAFEVSV